MTTVTRLISLTVFAVILFSAVSIPVRGTRHPADTPSPLTPSQKLAKAVADCADYGTVDLGSIILKDTLTLKGRTGVVLRGGNVYWQGPADRPAIEFVSSTRCEVRLQLLQNRNGATRTGTGVRVAPEDSSPISAVGNRVRIDMIEGFAVGIQIGAGNAKACDETSVADGTITDCVDGIRIDGGNAQLQYLDRVRMVWCVNACVHVAQGGAHLTNCTVAYSPYGVLIGDANPSVVLRDVYCEGGDGGMLYVATAGNSNNPGTLIVEGGSSYCRGPAGFKGFPDLSIRWNHNAPLTLNSHGMYRPILVEEGVVYGRGINLLDPAIKPADYFLARSRAKFDVAGSQRLADGTWKSWEYKGPGKIP